MRETYVRYKYPTGKYREIKKVQEHSASNNEKKIRKSQIITENGR